MFEVTYTAKDFDKIRMYKLNSDQLLTLLKSDNFVQKARYQVVVDSIKQLQKVRQIRTYQDRDEVMYAVKLMTEESALRDMPQSYMASLTHAVSKMRIEDEVVWARIAAHLANTHD